MARRVLIATAVAGTLDILAAMGLATAAGVTVPQMLRYVASGPVPPATGWGAGGAVLGLAVHYAIMVVMAATYIAWADARPAVKRSPLLFGALYGLVTYIVMNLIVVPLRFGGWPGPMSIGTQLFCHVVLVGLPIAFIAGRR